MREEKRREDPDSPSSNEDRDLYVSTVFPGLLWHIALRKKSRKDAHEGELKELSIDSPDLGSLSP